MRAFALHKVGRHADRARSNPRRDTGEKPRPTLKLMPFLTFRGRFAGRTMAPDPDIYSFSEPHKNPLSNGISFTGIGDKKFSTSFPCRCGHLHRYRNLETSKCCRNRDQFFIAPPVIALSPRGLF